MIQRRVALRYSKAQFDSGLAQGNFEKKMEDFDFLPDFLKKNPELVKFLVAPQINLEDKKKALESIFKDRFEPSFYHLLFYLIEKRRLNYLSLIAQEYRLMVNQYLGIWEAKIITAVAIAPEIEKTLTKKLEKVYRKKIKLNKEINPKMIGGAILLVAANGMIDWSVKERLRKMKENLMGNGFNQE